MHEDNQPSGSVDLTSTANDSKHVEGQAVFGSELLLAPTSVGRVVRQLKRQGKRPLQLHLLGTGRCRFRSTGWLCCPLLFVGTVWVLIHLHAIHVLHYATLG